MKKNYVVPLVEFVDFNGKALFTEGCSSDCSGCFYIECEPSDCYIANPNPNSQDSLQSASTSVSAAEPFSPDGTLYD